jgi:hypothetical protein
MSENNSVTLNLQMYSWIYGLIGEDDNAGDLLKRELKAGTTLGDFFTSLVEKYPNFAKFVLDPATGVMNDEVVMIFNNQLVQFNKVKDRVISDQDTVILSPVLVGG